MFYHAIALFPMEEVAVGIPVAALPGAPGAIPIVTPAPGGAPIAILGGVFPGSLPLGGPVTQIFRGGGGPTPPTLFVSTISPAGPIGNFFIGTTGAPIGVPIFMGGGLPIGAPPAVVGVEAALQARTAQVGATLGAVPPPALFNGGGMAAGGAPIGGGFAAPIGRPGFIGPIGTAGFAGPISGGGFGSVGGAGHPIGR